MRIDDASPRIDFFQTDTTDLNFQLELLSDFRFEVCDDAFSSCTRRMSIETTSDRIAIGTDTSPDYHLEILASSDQGYFGITNSVDGDIFEIDAAGNVGIGTSTPGSLFSIGDIANFTTATSTFYSGLELGSLNATSATSTLAGLWVTNILNCTQALETDANGGIVCGTDSEGSGTFAWDVTTDGVSTSTQVSFNSGASTTLLSVFNTAYFGGTATSTFDSAGVLTVAGNILPLSDDGASLGISGTEFSDLFLNTGGVINFEAGDVTITHSANALAFAGVTGNYSFDDSIVPSADGGGSLGISGTEWGDLFLDTGAVINFEAGDITITHSAGALNFGGGNIGIGTTTPYATLSVVGDTILDSNLIQFASSTASSLTIAYGIQATSTIIDGNAWAFTLATSTSASPIVRIDTSGSGNEGEATTTITGGVSINSGAFLYDYSANETSIERLNLGAISFEDDAGAVSWINLPITSTPARGTVESYIGQIDDVSVLTVYGEADGTGGVENLRVGVATSSPWGRLSVEQGTSSAPVFVVGDEGTTTPHFLIDGRGYVGLGTTTPGSLFSIDGIANFTTATSTLYSGLELSSLNATSATSTLAGLWITNVTNCTQALETDANGGIVCGTDESGGGGSFAWTLLTTYGEITSATTSPIWLQDTLYASSTSFFTATSTFYDDLIVDTNTLYVDAGTNNVGIGTSSPTNILDIARDINGELKVRLENINSGTGAVSFFSMGNGPIASDELQFAVAGAGFTTSGLVIQDAGHLLARAGLAGLVIATENTSGGGIIFGTGGLASSNERMRIDVLGNVGIGTSTPHWTFQVASSTPYFVLTDNDSALDSKHLLLSNVDGIFRIGTSTDDFSSTSTALSLDPRGPAVFGIGTSSPWRTLSVTGGVSFDGLTAGTLGNAVCITSGKDITDASADTCVVSSERFKENILTLSGGEALDILNQLNVVSFDYKQEFTNGENPASIGLIAEEVELIDTRLVDYDYEGRPMTLHFERITGLTVQAIQELNINLETLASTTASSTLASRSFADSFFSNLFTRITTWLADATNGIASLFAEKVVTKELCVADDSGEETCITKAQLDALLSGAVSGRPGGASTPAPVVEPTPDPVVDPVENSDNGGDGGGESEPTPDPVVDPVENSDNGGGRWRGTRTNSRTNTRTNPRTNPRTNSRTNT